MLHVDPVGYTNLYVGASLPKCQYFSYHICVSYLQYYLLFSLSAFSSISLEGKLYKSTRNKKTSNNYPKLKVTVSEEKTMFLSSG